MNSSNTILNASRLSRIFMEPVADSLIVCWKNMLIENWTHGIYLVILKNILRKKSHMTLHQIDIKI